MAAKIPAYSALADADYQQLYIPGTFSECVYGKLPFYEDPNYKKNTEADFGSSAAIRDVAYTYNTEGSRRRITKLALSIIFFPLGICHLTHCMAGKIILPASSTLLSIPKCIIEEVRRGILQYAAKDQIFKRITVKVDGYKVDALMIGKKSTIRNRRWILVSNGSGQFYELIPGCSLKKTTAHRLIPTADLSSFDDDAYLDLDSAFVLKIADDLHSNLLIFNYPGTQSSTGLPSREALIKSHFAMLNFLEDPRGIGAKEIIGYGFSVGGAAQAEALDTHTLKSGIKYVFIKDRTFSDLASAIHYILRQEKDSANPFLKNTFCIKTLRFLAWHGLAIKILGWNISCKHSSIGLVAPEIIIQRSSEETIQNPENIFDDSVIGKKASLANDVLKKKSQTQSKTLMGTEAKHTDSFEKGFVERLVQIISSELTKQPYL